MFHWAYGVIYCTKDWHEAVRGEAGMDVLGNYKACAAYTEAELDFMLPGKCVDEDGKQLTIEGKAQRLIYLFERRQGKLDIITAVQSRERTDGELH